MSAMDENVISDHSSPNCPRFSIQEICTQDCELKSDSTKLLGFADITPPIYILAPATETMPTIALSPFPHVRLSSSATTVTTRAMIMSSSVGPGIGPEAVHFDSPHPGTVITK